MGREHGTQLELLAFSSLAASACPWLPSVDVS